MEFKKVNQLRLQNPKRNLKANKQIYLVGTKPIPNYQDSNSMHLSQLNSSVSKQLYSFNKAQRFLKTPVSPCKQTFYNYQLGTITNRATSFGYGNKVEFINKQDVPPPGNYESKGEFSLNKDQRKGYSFSKNSKRSIINEEEATKVPGPGKYQTDKDIKFAHLKYSFRSKFHSIYEKSEHDLGPGQYKTLEIINKEGHHSISKYEDSKSRRFPRSQRFQQIRARTPGPGAYNQIEKLSMNKTGTYFNSRFKSNFSNVFGRSARPSIQNKSFSPGPGNYETFSQFNSTFR